MTSNLAVQRDDANSFRLFWDRGFKRIIPICPPDAEVSPHSTLFKRPGARGKAPGIKGADGLWRGINWLQHETKEADLLLWAEMGAGVGIKTGNGLVALDVDTLDEQLAAKVWKL